MTDFKECMTTFISKTNIIVRELRNVLERVENHKENCNVAKTVGSTISLAGSIVTIGGLFAAPFTGGISLALTVGGMSATAVGTGADIITDAVYGAATEKFVKEIQEIAEEYQSLSNELNNYFQNINKVIDDLKSKGFGEDVALYHTLKYMSNKENQLKTSDYVVEYAVKSVGKTGITVGSQSMAIMNVTMKSLKVVKNIRIAGTVFSVVGIAYDFYNIMNTWSRVHPTEPVIKETINSLNSEMQKVQQLLDFYEQIETRELEQMALQMQEIFGDDIVIATVKNFPIIGTNMSSVEALVALIEEDFEKALSKILDMLPFKPNEETLSYINDYIKEYSKELKTNLRELRNNLGEFIAQLLGIQSTPIIKRCVKNIVQELNGTISQTMSDEKNKEKKSKKKRDHVINNDVLKIYKKIIEDYVKKAFGAENVSFDDLKPYIDPNGSVFCAINDPFNNLMIKKNIETMVAHMDADRIDANAVVYGLTIRLFIKFCSDLMKEKTRIKVNNNTHEYEIDYSYKNIKTQAAVNALIIFINSTQIYVDIAAFNVWIQQGGKIETFKNSKKAIVKMFERLNATLSDEWIIEICRAFQEFKLIKDLME